MFYTGYCMVPIVYREKTVPNPSTFGNYFQLFLHFFVSVIIVEDKMKLFFDFYNKKGSEKEPVKFCYS